jgi:glycosyltransferase involved in cell wall biosynthesis
MISVVIPTCNRAYALAATLQSYYTQELVSEIVIIDDASEDTTASVVDDFAGRFPGIRTRYHRNSQRYGSYRSRYAGARMVSQEFVIFGEDDVILDGGYAATLREKLLSDQTVAIISGRIVYLRKGERTDTALLRFGSGSQLCAPFNTKYFGPEPNARFEGDIAVPFTHAVFMTRKSLLETYELDPFYARGNGFREESDFQVILFLRQFKIVQTNSTRCFHLSRQETKRGGHRMNRFKRFFWGIYLTDHFFGKYFNGLRSPLGIRYGKNHALFVFSLSAVHKLFLVPARKLIEDLLKTS